MIQIISTIKYTIIQNKYIIIGNMTTREISLPVTETLMEKVN
jgi:hypothetical protein